MSNRRKVKPPRPERVERLVVDPENFDTVKRGLQSVRECAACHGRAYITRDGLQVQHIGDCPAMHDSSLIMEVH
jgi:hypothetical protein